jgi:PAS domain-containing protein
MKTEIHFNKSSQVINLASILIYILIFLVLFKSAGPLLILLSLIPIAVIGFTGGLLYGLLAGILLTFVNVVLLRYSTAGMAGLGDTILALAAGVCIGAISGRLSDLSSNLEKEKTLHVKTEEFIKKCEFVFNNSKDMIALINRDYVYEMVNSRFCTAINKSPKSIVGKPVKGIWEEKVFNEILKPYIDRAFG